MPLAGELIRAFDVPTWDEVTTNESTASTTFTNLATTGPDVTVNLRLGQTILIIMDVQAFVSAAGTNGALATVEVAGPSTSDLAAADSNGIETGHATEWTPGTKHTPFTATAAGDHTITMKYRVIGAFTASFKQRRLTIVPFP